MASAAGSALRDVFNHVILPPDFPSSQDKEPVVVEKDLLCLLCSAIQELETLGNDDPTSHVPVAAHFRNPTDRENLAHIRQSLQFIATFHDKYLPAHPIRRWLDDSELSAPLIVYVRAQNAALIMWKPSQSYPHASIEAFEAAPTNAAVMGASNALNWDFPDTTACVPVKEFVKEVFRETLTSFLVDASSQELSQFASGRGKAQGVEAEIQDPPDPALITEVLMPMLQSIGNYEYFRYTGKRVRDEVSWSPGSPPWRRSPFWLVLRVACQRILARVASPPAARAVYKAIMVMVHVRLLRSSQVAFGPDHTMVVLKKLCRRISKLENDRERNPQCRIYATLFDSRLLEEAVEIARRSVEMAWEEFKNAGLRRILNLPARPSEADIRLDLLNSLPHIESVAKEANSDLESRPAVVVVAPPADDHEWAESLWNRASAELAAADAVRETSDDAVEEIAGKILELVGSDLPPYAPSPEQCSEHVLAALSLWVAMDTAAVTKCPVLSNYGPIFRAESLDILQLSTRRQMERLQEIQTYLDVRQKSCRYADMNIFSEPDRSCLAAQLVEQQEENSEGRECLRLWNVIWEASERAEEQKRAEWQDLNDRYQGFCQDAATLQCVCDIPGQRRIGSSSVCGRCRAGFEKEKLTIKVHEPLLPQPLSKRHEGPASARPVRDLQQMGPSPASAVILLELTMPDHLAAYRDATWAILRDLATPQLPDPDVPPLLFEDFEPFRRFGTTNYARRSVSLASQTESHLHSQAKFPVARDDVFKRFGPHFDYVARGTGISPSVIAEGHTFSHLCGLRIPPRLGISPLPKPLEDEWPARLAPTSYEVAARRGGHLPHVSAQERAALQRLVSGSATRWMALLIELASPNLNLYSEDTVVLLEQLVLQKGPLARVDDGYCGTPENVWEVHQPLGDPSFCDRLAEQLDHRLSIVAGNWRGTRNMNFLLTLTLRLHELCTDDHKPVADALVSRARSIARSWVSMLRDEIRASTDADHGAERASFLRDAALLCRRTMAVFARPDREIPPEAVGDFAEASIALREHCAIHVEALPVYTQEMLVRDHKLVWAMREKLSIAIRRSPALLERGITMSWPDPTNARRFAPWVPTGLQGWNKGWLESSTRAGCTVHFNFLDGRLLVNGKPVGNLPRAFARSAAVQALFGGKALQVYPSEAPGTTHSLSTSSETGGWTVLFGMRDPDRHVFVRAQKVDQSGELQVLEYLPPDLFVDEISGADSFDLPASLLTGCVHWLDVKTGEVEIRRRPNIWAPRRRHNDWSVRTADRCACRSESRLVDPHSDLFRAVAAIFKGFAPPRCLTVFASETGNTRVEISHLELSFFVNGGGLLQCEQLNAEVDPDQDVGTWYGCGSMLVLRDVAGRRRRSIIVPTGPLAHFRNGIHVSVSTMCPDNNIAGYARFLVDPILGRLTCAPDPQHLYFKAQMHAFTSFVLPDPLTGRTGTEEAFALLRSGACQPWEPLAAVHYDLLRKIASLSPARDYCGPDGMWEAQSAKWSDQISAWSQHDGFRPAVAEILKKSRHLVQFANRNVSPPDPDLKPELCEDASPRLRAEVHRLRFEKADGDSMRGFLPGCHEDTYHVPRYYRATLGRPRLRSGVRWAMDLLDSATARTIRMWPQHTLEGLKHAHPADVVPGEVLKMASLMDADDNSQWWSWTKIASLPLDRICHKYFLALLCARTRVSKPQIVMLAAFTRDSSLRDLEMPLFGPIDSFRYRNALDEPRLRKIIDGAACFYGSDDDDDDDDDVDGKSSLDKNGVGDGPCPDEENVETTSEWRQHCESERSRLFSLVCSSWRIGPPGGGELYSDYIDVEPVASDIYAEWRRASENHLLSNYIDGLDRRLAQHPEADGYRPCPAEIEAPEMYVGRSRLRDRVNFRDLLARPLVGMTRPDKAVRPPPYGYPLVSVASDVLPSRREAMAELGDILRPLLAPPSTNSRYRYAEGLQQSLDALEAQDTPPVVPRALDSATLKAGIEETVARLDKFEQAIRASLAHNDARYVWLQAADLWPTTSRMSLLEKLASRHRYRFGKGTKEALVEFALELAHLQKQTRLEDALLCGDEHRLDEELQNPGHWNWDPHENSDWLLLELDGDFLIRPDQVRVARATISPSSGDHSVLQMNMGQGKSSVVMPMVAAVLANGHRLCRLVVPKTLLSQTAQIVQSRLGGLLGRDVTHVPFSRAVETGPGFLDRYKYLHRHSLDNSGIMLCLPENIISFQLGGIQKILDGKPREGCEMIGIHSWLGTHCRDVLDESDLILAPKTQLIYPGSKRVPVDGQPQRWTAIQALLGLVRAHVELMDGTDKGLRVVKGSGFPLVFFFDKTLEDKLVGRVVDDVASGNSPLVRSPTPNAPLYGDSVKEVIYSNVVDGHAIRKTCEGLGDPAAAAINLMLVRGLVRQRILLFCLKKRWNVEYGLHPRRRPPMAVPFEAAGVPSEQAEFGHPDVAIILTCLAFYHAGLDPGQLKESLERVLSSADPDTEYGWWISEPSGRLRDDLRHWRLVDPADDGQVMELWTRLRHSRPVLDHHMNAFVFPQHARQSDSKLQASGWDIPFFPENGLPEQLTGVSRTVAGSTGLTTGFSGTNDNRHMLPLTIRQRDLPALRGTSAEVLAYLLEKRNRSYAVVADETGRLTARALLSTLGNRKIRILIDAGGCLHGPDNESLAQAWLEADAAAKAAVFFGGNNRARVRYRSGWQADLAVTPLAENLEGCLVYIDAAHTRGTDLKLPPAARAVLTLGIGQTKDHTVQAAMRLRLLGTTQSVLFVAPPEVDASIRAFCQTGADAGSVSSTLDNAPAIDSANVVAWLLEQTCSESKQAISLYHAQGLDFCRRTSYAVKHGHPVGRIAKYIRSIQFTDHQTLEELYCRPAGATCVKMTSSSSLLVDFASQLRDQMAEHANGRSVEILQEVVNEQVVDGKETVDLREVVREEAAQGVAQEEHLQKAVQMVVQRVVQEEADEKRRKQDRPARTPHKFHGLDPDIRHFAFRGRLMPGSSSYVTVFEALRRTAVGKRFRVRAYGSPVHVSTEWARTVHTDYGLNEGALRPVEWVLVHPGSQTALVVITEEAEMLVREMRAARIPPKSHLIAYAAATDKSMAAMLATLKYYALPPLPGDFTPAQKMVADLGILAGRLYFDWSEYGHLVDYFHGEGPGSMRKTFADCPVGFMEEWLEQCHGGQDTTSTPMGYICAGRAVDENHPFFAHGGDMGGGDGSGEKRAVDDDGETNLIFFKIR